MNNTVNSTRRTRQTSDKTFIVNRTADAPEMDYFRGVHVQLAGTDNLGLAFETEIACASFNGTLEEAEQFAEALAEACRIARAAQA